MDFISFYMPDFLLQLQTMINLLLCIYFYLEEVESVLPDIENLPIGCRTNFWKYNSQGIIFFRFIDCYDSLKTWRNRIRRIKLEIISSFTLLLNTKSCKVFLDFTYKRRCSLSVRYRRFSNLFFCSCMESLLLRIIKPLPLS